MLVSQPTEKMRENQMKGYILACKVFCVISLVKAPMPLLEMAAMEKWYSVFGRRFPTTYEDAGPNVFFIYWARAMLLTMLDHERMMYICQCEKYWKKKRTLNSYLGPKAAFPVAKFIVYNSFFLIGCFPGQFNAGIGHSTNLKFGWLTWNWRT